MVGKGRREKREPAFRVVAGKGRREKRKRVRIIIVSRWWEKGQREERKEKSQNHYGVVVVGKKTRERRGNQHFV